jgi:rubredoxin
MISICGDLIMKQRWECKVCGESNFVEFDPKELVTETQNKMIDNHQWLSPECENEDLTAPVFLNVGLKFNENIKFSAKNKDRQSKTDSDN